MFHCPFYFPQFFFVFAQKQKVIHVADVMANFQLVLYELIKFIEVDIGEKLGSQIANGNSGFSIFEKVFVFDAVPMAVNCFTDNFQNSFIFNLFLDDGE